MNYRTGKERNYWHQRAHDQFVWGSFGALANLPKATPNTDRFRKCSPKIFIPQKEKNCLEYLKFCILNFYEALTFDYCN